MKIENKSKSQLSRRKFLTTTSSIAAFAFVPLHLGFSSDPQTKKSGKPDSNFGGVQIGSTTYSWRSMVPFTAEEILKFCIAGGISSIEMQGIVAEQYAGIPQGPKTPPRVARSDEEIESIKKAEKILEGERRKWRLSLPMKKYEDLRKMFNDAGVKIHMLKSSPENWSDEEIDYTFRAAKALGAKCVGAEIGEIAAKRMGSFAQKHGMYAIFHQHLQPAEPGWTFEKFLEYSPNNMLNFDTGHYFGCTGLHPNGILERLHDRILTVHIKDKTGPKSNPADTNMPFGKGETPISDILLLIKKNKWPINVDIELEYKIPEDSNAVAEVKKCVEYCKAILT
jgi:sugar phosphate isomerase/epimerase